MKILCAPDSFKETIAASDAAAAMMRGTKLANPAATVDLCPVADGGEGTMDALNAAMGGEIHDAMVIGPAGRPVKARFAICNDVGLVELAQASGLALVRRNERDPTAATTFGTGQLIACAVARGCSTIIICIGSSATVDGGTGIAQALGAQFFGRQEELIDEPLTGGALKRITHWSPAIQPLPGLRVACDVTNPLCGPNGAAAVYGPQKGATPQQVRELDEGLAHLAQIVAGDPNFPGAGAAGGAGFGLVTMCGAKLERGIDLVLDAVGFIDRCRNASLVLTGEGRLDSQSLQGKACMGVANAAAKLGVPTIAIVGCAGEGAEDCLESRGGFLSRYISLADRFGMDRAMREPASCIAAVAHDLMRPGH